MQAEGTGLIGEYQACKRRRWRWSFQTRFVRAATHLPMCPIRVRLPATRDFAKQYGVSRGTAVTVFEELVADGYLRCQKRPVFRAFADGEFE
jgi:DNA-binding transcriptional MocR family regulator